jgi:hypothetical protein
VKIATKKDTREGDPTKVLAASLLPEEKGVVLSSG